MSVGLDKLSQPHALQTSSHYDKPGQSAAPPPAGGILVFSEGLPWNYGGPGSRARRAGNWASFVFFRNTRTLSAAFSKEPSQ
jgi:hypothetical protein